jgi:mRNA-degrading endonuclease RelE of RelBE toxin-antitoxin system
MMMNKVMFEKICHFDKDCKRLQKKYRTLLQDLEIVKIDLMDEPGESPPFSYRIDNLGIQTSIIKVKKIACKSLKGKGVNSGLRLIYAHFSEQNRIVLVELYHKNEKESEDRNRILENFK